MIGLFTGHPTSQQASEWTSRQSAMIRLTARQQEVLRFLQRFIAHEGMPPTQAEIAQAFGFTQKAAAQHLRLMAAKGVLELRRDQSRGIRLRALAETAMAGPEGWLPLIGRVAAGPPVLATEEIDEWLPISPELFRPKADYLRRVSGESMIGLGIRSGDLIGVKQVPEAGSGQVVVARLGGPAGTEITVKRFLRDGSTVRLAAYNPGIADLVVDLDADPHDQRFPRIEIEGLYCGHFHPHSGL